MYVDMPDAALPQDADSILRLLDEEAADPAHGTSLLHLIANSDPVTDSAGLESIRQVLQSELRAARADDRAGTRETIARIALRFVASRRSPIAVDLDRYLAGGPPGVSPAGVRAAAMLSSFRRLDELIAALNADEEMLTRDLSRLVRLGILIAETDSFGRECSFCLTPAGRPALAKLAAQVVEFELGRFRWPDDVPEPFAWAEAKGQQVFPFERRGRDYEVVAECLGGTAGQAESLSVRNLYGLAKPKPKPQPPAAHLRIHTMALLAPDLGPILPRMTAIIDEHRRVEHLVDDRADLSITVFTNSLIREKHGADVLELCSDNDVACDFATAA